MILIVGGQGAGKRDYVLHQLGYTPDQIADGVLDGCPVLDNLQNAVSAQGALPLEALLEKEVIICREIGCGIVPLQEEKRQWRDEVGKLATQLAGRAQRVVRLCCGIPTVIKEEKPWLL